MTTTTSNSIDDALAALRAGRLVIVVDASDRENEGDFVGAAESITAEQVDFMLSHGRGVMCAPLTRDVADRLRLSPLVGAESNSSPNHTPFLTPVDHRDSGTGVSAESRTKTLRALVDATSMSSDFVRPGHLNPLLAREGGVLRRAGHTEATVDLLRIAGLKPVGVLIEILSQKHAGMAVEHEDQEPLALVWGDLKSIKAPLVRMHSSCFTGDVLDSLRCDCGDQLRMAMDMISHDGIGAVVYLPQEGRGIGLVAKLKAYQLQDQGLDTVEANHKLGFKADQRDYMIGLQILKDLGLSQIRILTNNPKKLESFEHTWDLHVVEQVPIIAPPHQHRQKYMETKRDKMGHKLPPTV